MTIRFEPITQEQYCDWVGGQGKNRYIITMVGRKITAEHISNVTRAISEEGLNIDDINRLTGRMPLDEDDRAPKTSIEFSVRGTLSDKGHFQNELMKITKEGDVDLSFQRDGIFRRSRRLICFDMDSTLIETEVIDELAKRAGVGENVAEPKRLAYRPKKPHSEGAVGEEYRTARFVHPSQVTAAARAWFDLIYLPLSFLIPSSSGLATLSIPIIAPLGKFAGVGGDLVVTAFQSASGLVNLITPTAAVVMGALALGHVPYDRWLKFVWKLLAVFALLTLLFLAAGAAMG